LLKSSVKVSLTRVSYSSNAPLSAATNAQGMGLQAGSKAGKADVEGFVTAIYFCLVTALSIGYGAEVELLGAESSLARRATGRTQ
jgi:hypothetical protein